MTYESRVARVALRSVLAVAAFAAASLGFEARAGLETLQLESDKLTLARPAPGVAPHDVIGLTIDGPAYRKLEELGSAVVENFPLPGRGPVNLQLTAFDPLAKGARFVVVDAAGERVVPRPDIRFYRGLVVGDVDSLVTLSLFEGRIAGFVRAFGEEFGFGPKDFNLARAGATDIQVWNSEATEEKPDGPICDGDQVAPPRETNRAQAAPPPPGSVGPDTMLRATVAVDATVEWYNRFGSVTAAQNYILNLMAQVSTIYENEVNVQIQVPYVRVFTAEPDPYTNGSTNTSQLLAELVAEWNANQTGVSRSAVHLFSHRSSGGSGIAYVDVLCDNNAQPGSSHDYGVTTLPGSGASWEKEIVAHELGHNFSSPHTHCYAPEIDQCATQSGCYQGPIVQTVGTIMSYCNQKTPVFGQRVRDMIRPAAEAASCLSIAGDPGDLRGETENGLTLRKAPQCSSATLANDDGSMNTSFGLTGTWQMAWIKRLTPTCYPLRLDRLDVLIPASTGVAVGRPLRLLVYVDPTGSGNPANATLIRTQDVTVQVTSTSAYNQYTLTQPVILTSGSLYAGFYDLSADSSISALGAVDNSRTGDAYRATNSTSPESFTSYTGGTWMIRGAGSGVGAGTPVLEWGNPCNTGAVPDQDFAVYQGTLGNFTSKTSLTCSTGGANAFVATGTPANSFFLVVPLNATNEGSYGQTSAGAERPAAALACKPQSIGSCQ